MKRSTGLMVCALPAGTSAGAMAGEREQLRRLADEAGVSVDDVRMVLGSRSQHARYRTSFDRKEARIRAAMARLAILDAERERKLARTR